MAVSLKSLKDQTIVITGASSGVGLTTARMAAKEGAKLVLAARSEEALRQLETEINSSGGQALAVVADVGNESDVRKIADAAISRFGGFDTWVNNAGVSIYGTIEQVSTEDNRRLFETNFWGVVYGSRIALETLRSRGGALINLGSTLSDRAIPLQGMYSASKFAVRAFTDALRMEIEEAGLPVSVTLIKPAGMNTPYIEHAKNYLDTEPTLPRRSTPPRPRPARSCTPPSTPRATSTWARRRRRSASRKSTRPGSPTRRWRRRCSGCSIRTVRRNATAKAGCTIPRGRDTCTDGASTKATRSGAASTPTRRRTRGSRPQSWVPQARRSPVHCLQRARGTNATHTASCARRANACGECGNRTWNVERDKFFHAPRSTLHD
jgi:NADP-dependent 3-hydroxy acid dehydrogenase YdfG